MTDIIIECIRALVLGIIAVIMLRRLRDRALRDIQGRKYLSAGIILVFCGALLDVTDNFSSLGRFLIVGDTVYESILEKLVGYLLGYILIAVGLKQWLPAVITARTTEKALRESEERFRAIFDTAIDGIVVADSETKKFVLANRTFCSMLGYGSDEVMQLGVFDIHPAESLLYVVGQFEKQLRKEITLAKDIPVKRKDGTVFFADVNASPMILAGRQCLLGSFRDITERRQAELSLQKSEAFTKDILQSVGEGFVVIDPEYRILSANRAYCRQTKLSCEGILGKHCYEVSHRIGKPCYLEGEDCAPRHTFATGAPHFTVHTHYDKDGNPVYIETRSFPMKDAEGKIYAVLETLNNVTEKRALEGQLRHAQKMEAIGTLANGIAHDFNNMLTVIIGYAALMQMHLRPDDPHMPRLKEIMATADRATQLTKGLLSFSRKQAMETRTVDLNTIIEGFKKMLARIISEDIELRMTTTGQGLMIKADTVQIEQVLMNLAVNARDAMRQGGLLTIATMPARIDQSFIRAHGYGEPGDYALLTLTDSGAGMDEKTRERIFEPFFTTKEPGRGTGLGLAIVYGIVKQHNGYLNCSSEPGKGTTFKIYLPLVKAAAEAMGAAEAAFPRGGAETILIAEDDAGVRRLVSSILEEHGYTVIEAIDGDDAVAKAGEYKGDIHVLFADLIMPKKNGKDAYEELQATRPDMKVMFTSGYAADVIQRFNIEAGALFISKPVAPNALLGKLRQVLDDGKK